MQQAQATRRLTAKQIFYGAAFATHSVLRCRKSHPATYEFLLPCNTSQKPIYKAPCLKKSSVAVLLVAQPCLAQIPKLITNVKMVTSSLSMNFCVLSMRSVVAASNTAPNLSLCSDRQT